MSLREWLGFKPRIGDLAKRLLRRLHEQGASGWRYDAGDQTLTHTDGMVVNLVNIHLEYAAAARSVRTGLLEKYLYTANIQDIQIPELWSLAQHHVYAVVRCAAEQSQAQLLARTKGGHWPAALQFSLAADLCVRLMYDFGPALCSLKPEQLTTWGQSPETVRDVAMANLRALPRGTWSQPEPGVWAIHSSESYEESLLLIDKQRAALPFIEHAVYMVPNRGVLLAADGRDSGAVHALVKHAHECLRLRPWPMSAAILELHAGTWREHTVSGATARIRADAGKIQLAQIYQDQKALLEQALKHEEKDIFVASYALIRCGGDDGPLQSWCAWTEDVHSLLPQTDLIMFGASDQQMLCVSWDAAMEICADLLTPTELDPPRFELSAFPGALQWQALGRVAITLTRQ